MRDEGLKAVVTLGALEYQRGCHAPVTTCLLRRICQSFGSHFLQVTLTKVQLSFFFLLMVARPVACVQRVLETFWWISHDRKHPKNPGLLDLSSLSALWCCCCEMAQLSKSQVLFVSIVGVPRSVEKGISLKISL